MSNSKKKPVEFYFVDMNDPGRYKKLKVLKACDFCRQRKSKCDIGVPGSGTCSNCRKANIYCIFSSNKDSPDENRCFDNHNNRSSDNSLDLSVEQQEREQQQQNQQISSHFIQSHMCLEHSQNIPKRLNQSTALMHSIYNQFPAFEFDCMDTTGRPQADSIHIKTTSHSYNNKLLSSLPPPSSSSVLLFLFSLSENAQLASLLYQAYSRYIHPYFPLLHDQPSELSVYSALLTILCYIRPPELLLCSNNNNMLLSPTDAKAYMHQAEALCLDKWSLGAAQTLLLLHKYQEMTSTTLPWTDYYLERACTIFDNLFTSSNYHYQQQEIYSIQWLLYVSMGLLPKQQQQNIVYKEWMEKCYYNDHCSQYYQQQSTNSSSSPLSHTVYSNHLNSNDNVIMTNLKELIKLLKFYYTHTTQESASVSPHSSCNTNKQFQQMVVDWKLKLPRHLYNNDTTVTAAANSRDDSRKLMIEYNTYYSTCLLFLSDTLLLLSHHSNHGSRPCAKDQPLSLSESLATIARLQQCAHTLVSTGYFLILGQSTILLALKLALNELICTYTTCFAFSQQQEERGENSIVHWFGDWCSQSIWICKHLNMDNTFFLDHLCKFRDALIEGDILTRYYHQHYDSYYCYSFQKQNQQQKQQRKNQYYDKQQQLNSYHVCSSYKPLSSPSLIPTSSVTTATTTVCNSNDNNGNSFSPRRSYRGSGSTEDGGSIYGEFPTTPTVNGDKSQASDYFQNTTSAWVHTTSSRLSLGEHHYQQVIIYYPVIDNNDSQYDYTTTNIYG